VTNPIRIAMWSGPRNISTAMMYSFDNRDDTIAIDEPFYAHYLQKTAVDHPDSQLVIQAGETDWQIVANRISTGPTKEAKIYYQKHMAHHLFQEMHGDWMKSLTHCILIREPREVLLSLSKKIDNIDARSTGIPQQVELLETLQSLTGQNPPVIDSRDVLENPQGMLSSLCQSIDIPFDESMLSWKPGPRECDGIWAPHWYDVVWKSNGFSKYQARHGELNQELEDVYSECKGYYEKLYNQRLCC
jgi:hypothetical protein|tara:strand:+ start:163 stop:897 length:735 start_codon:yes stop_codon:yes gene_type:complete